MRGAGGASSAISNIEELIVANFYPAKPLLNGNDSNTARYPLNSLSLSPSLSFTER
jgi:hypothetical protein